jgi:hypothetical protein
MGFGVWVFGRGDWLDGVGPAATPVPPAATGGRSSRELRRGPFNVGYSGVTRPRVTPRTGGDDAGWSIDSWWG